MDEGVLRFVAEAYLLLHAGTIVQPGRTAESAGTNRAKAEKPQRGSSDLAVQGEPSMRQVPGKQSRSKVRGNPKGKGEQNHGPHHG